MRYNELYMAHFNNVITLTRTRVKSPTLQRQSSPRNHAIQIETLPRHRTWWLQSLTCLSPNIWMEYHRAPSFSQGPCCPDQHLSSPALSIRPTTFPATPSFQFSTYLVYKFYMLYFACGTVAHLPLSY